MAKTVMIVEDNELNMKLFHDLLEAHGYLTVGTRNGIEALDLARKHRPDLILMDIQLPEVSGLEVTKWLKEDPELRAIPVVAVTAFAMKGDEERIREGGCEAYLSKPISVGKFIETIRRFLAVPATVRPDWWMICQVAQRMGFGDGFNYSSVADIFDEHARLSALENDGARAFHLGGLVGLVLDSFGVGLGSYANAGRELVPEIVAT